MEPTGTTTDTPSMPELVKAYLEARNAVRALEEKHERELEALREPLDDLAARILAVCNATGADTIRTAEGTVSRRIQERYWTTDWESMRKFILEHEATQLLEQRIHRGNMREFLNENPDLLPAGLQIDRKYVVSVRKPSAK